MVDGRLNGLVELSQAEPEVSALRASIPSAVRDALLDYNDMLRSAAGIAERRGAETGWDSFRRRLSTILKRHHETWLALYKDDPVVGHMTMDDGSHLPLRQSAAEALWAQAESARARRQSDMPDEQSAIRQLNDAQKRLKELGWGDPIYCPKDGSEFDVIELGSTGIHKAHYSGEWPTGSWWIAEAGDLWPSRPAMYRKTEAELARWAELGKRFRDSDRSGEAVETTGSTEGESAGPKDIAQTPPYLSHP